MTRIEFNEDAFYELRRAPGVKVDLEARGNRVKSAAGEGYELESRQGAKRDEGRWRVSVVTATPEAMEENQDENTLLRALEAGR